MTYTFLLKTLLLIVSLILAFLIYNDLFVINEESLVALTFILFMYLALSLFTDVVKASITSKRLQIKSKFYDLKPIINKEELNFFTSVNSIGNSKFYDISMTDYYHIVYNFINDFRTFKRVNSTKANILTNKILKRSFEDLKLIFVYETCRYLRIEVIVLMYLIHIYVLYIPTIFLSYVRNYVTNRYNDLYILLLTFVKYKRNRYFFIIYKTIVRELFKKIYKKVK